MMLVKLIEQAKKGDNVFITNVRADFKKMSDSQRVLFRFIEFR
jgi:hypothetical protein